MTFKATYEEEIKAFRKYIEYLLAKAWEDEERGDSKPIEALYNETFKLTFKGATIELSFGPDEFECITNALEEIEGRIL